MRLPRCLLLYLIKIFSTFVNGKLSSGSTGSDGALDTYLLAAAAFDPPAQIAALNPKGHDQVAKVKLEAAFGGTSKICLPSLGRYGDRANAAVKKILEGVWTIKLCEPSKL